MTTYLPTIRQLQYLIALKDYGHFGKAAESCFVTQSTLSASLRELEALVGVTLVERTRRVVRFTPLGAKIADKARRVLRETEELADMARAEGQPLHGELRMGVIPTIAPFLLPAMLPRLREQWPSLKIFLREEASQAACDALHRGQLDCVLLAMPYACGDVDTAMLFDDRLFVAFPGGEAPKGTPGGASVEAAAIDENRLLLLEDGHCLKDHALAACNRPELRAEAAMMGTSLHTLVQMVDNGLGLTFVPSMAIEAGILDGTDIEARPLRSDHGYRRIALVWRRSSPREEEFRLLAETLRQISRKVIPSLAAAIPGDAAARGEGRARRGIGS
ncbi:MAG TPA: LysR substrate-binding domain-containing protein [Sphingomicrobium sp.]|nr:LysR substrate-binding domain-containing protein [Sphingomicrobium sp.]